MTTTLALTCAVMQPVREPPAEHLNLKLADPRF